MDDRLINLYLSRILSGYYSFVYKDQRYKLKYPDMSIKYEADIIANEEYEKNKYSGWHTLESIVYTLINIGLWTHGGDHELKSLEKQIEDQKVALYKNHINPNKVKSIRRNLETIKKKHNKLYLRRHSFDHITIEGYCDNIKNEFLLIHSVLDSQDKLILKEKDDYPLFNNIAGEISRHSIDMNFFRRIARSDLWRNYWSANQDNIFGKPVIEWTDEQKTLVVLTKMYDGAKESMESPPDHIYDDDDMFDGWMILQRREGEKSKTQRRNEKELPGKLNKAGEVFLVASSKEEAENIYGMNDDQSRGVIRERQKFIGNTSEKEEIDSTALPDVRRDILIQSNEKRKNKG